MKLLFCLAVSTILLTLLENPLRKRPYLLYLGALLLGIVGSFLPAPIASFITRGTLATSLFVIVMYARVLPVKSRLYKTFMSLRAPIAIAASFLIFIHNGKTLYGYIKAYVFVGAVLKPYEIFAAICSAIMFCLLIPLTITSFMPIRKKMKPLHWKKLQKTSYLFYFLIYLHVAFLFGYQITKGKTSYCIDLAIYTFVFGNYLFCRVALFCKHKKKILTMHWLQRGGFALVTVTSVFIGCILIIWGTNQTKPLQTESVALAQSIPSTSIEASKFSTSPDSYLQGEYWGEAMGYNGAVKIKIQIADGKITDLKYVEYLDDDDYFLDAWKKISSQILTTQNTTDVDVVSGATYSSKGIINAIQNALSRAITEQSE